MKPSQNLRVAQARWFLAACLCALLHLLSPAFAQTNVSSNASETNQTGLLPKTNSIVPDAQPAKDPKLTAKPVNNAETNPVRQLNSIPSENIIPAATNQVDAFKDWQLQLQLGREQRREKNHDFASKTFIGILENNAPEEIKRQALLELALNAQDEKQFVRAQQIFNQCLHRYPEDASAPEVLLRQALLYREMGLNELALVKFYAVMNSALTLNLNQLDYYKRLVLQAQTEIADTYYLAGKLTEAADFFNRLLKLENPALNKMQIHFKLIRCLSTLGNHAEAVAQSQQFLKSYPSSPELPEARFLLAKSLKALGRNHDSMQQVLKLLESQQAIAMQNPENWIYWQQRAGNDIANQLYKEGDYISALEIYLNLAKLDKSPAWQIPVWYQIALVYERLQQPEKAREAYSLILSREKELENPSPSLLAVIEMCKWRRDYIGWLSKAQSQTLLLQNSASTTNKATLAAQ